MRKAIAIVAYDRSHYFELVVPSILKQLVGGRPVHEEYDIFIFQDGLCVEDPKSDAVGHSKLAAAAKRSVQADRFFPQQANLGVALHFDFIERKLFEEHKYDFVLFCEDDLVLAPNYVEVVDMMAEKFKDDRRVGIVSCHPGDHRKSQEDQHKNYENYLPMEHLWGYGLYRSTWAERQPFVDQYLSYVGTVPYRQRDEKRIFNWMKACGFAADASSQDYVKHCFTIALGYARVSTFFNLGLPIGRIGLHSTLKNFEKLGLDKAVIYDGEIRPLGEFEQDQYKRLLTHHSKAMDEPAVIPDTGVDQDTIDGWHEKLKRGELAFEGHDGDTVVVRQDPAQPELLKQSKEDANLMEPANAASANTQADPVIKIADQPHMEDAGLELFRSRVEQSACLLEFGAGGSTVMASRLGVSTIISVESDAQFFSAVEAKISESTSVARLVSHPVDIGPTGDWGKPIDRSKAELWPSYCSSVWERIHNDKLPMPDLILIDGRFRVSCFLTSMIFANPGTRVLFDDYFDRPFYHIAEKHFKTSEKAGRMAEFIVPDNVDPRSLLVDLLAFSATVD